MTAGQCGGGGCSDDPAQKTVRRLEEEFGHVIRETFRIEPPALTTGEVQDLVGFRTAEEIRGRSAEAKQTTDLRRRSKGIYLDRAGRALRQDAIRRQRQVPFPARAPVTLRTGALNRALC